MKSLDLIYQHKGYGRFPYVIQRLRNGLYKQIPIHIEENSSKRAEGLFLSPEALSEATTFEAACKTRFRSFWLQSSAKAKTPINACLVFNPQEAYYLDEKCEGTTGTHSSGRLVVCHGRENTDFRGGGSLFRALTRSARI